MHSLTSAVLPCLQRTSLPGVGRRNEVGAISKGKSKQPSIRADQQYARSDLHVSRILTMFASFSLAEKGRLKCHILVDSCGVKSKVSGSE